MTGRSMPFASSGNRGDLIRPDVSRERPALVDLSASARRWSYAQLDAAAEGFAASLVRTPLPTDARVAILAENCAEYLIAYMGTMRAGCVSVPVNHRLPADTVRHILADCRAELCVVDAAREALVPPALARIVMRSPGAAALEARGPAASPAARRTPPPTGEILHTSGSTGRPKGVVLSHAGQLWALGVHVGATPTAGERSLIVAPLYHMNALFNVSVCLLHAIEVVLMPRFAAVPYLNAAAEYRCTLVPGIPTLISPIDRHAALLD